MKKFLLSIVFCVLFAPAVFAGDLPNRAQGQKLLDDGIDFLLSRIESDGGWSLGNDANKPAITALVLKALLQSGRFSIDSPAIEKGFDVLMKYRCENGGFYQPSMGLQNYTTSIALMAIVARGDDKYRSQAKDALNFLRSQQIRAGSQTVKGESISSGHPFEGGVSYGAHGRPDLSNQGMWMQAMHDAGVNPDDPDMQKALKFVLRLQNRKESNSAQFVAEGSNDGGFVYAYGESKAGADIGGRGLRSYGSMTYVGLKSMLYAGLKNDDPRVAAAFKWIRRYWTLDHNPHMPGQQSYEGLFYYYHVFAKALNAWGEDVIMDMQGNEHNWREELISNLAQRAQPDGAWVNEHSSRWNEGNPVLSTCYCVLSLQEALKQEGNQ